MSVVNDVLRNLDERQNQRQVAGASPFFYEEEKNTNKWLWLGLFLAVISCSVMASIIYMQNSDFNGSGLAPEKSMTNMQLNTAVVPLPEDLFSDPIETVHDLNDLKQNDANTVSKIPDNNQHVVTEPKQMAVIAPVSHVLTPVKKAVAKPLAITPKPKTVIAKKTVSSKASESAVNAINSGDVNTARSNLTLASSKVQEEVQLRLLLKENPKEVFTRIKRKHHDFKSNATLLALAAQGEQRSGLHQSAVQLYKSLIPLEPEQSKWRAGLAISLESLGDTESAVRLYQLALSMNNLPTSLRRFSERRLARLNP